MLKSVYIFLADAVYIYIYIYIYICMYVCARARARVCIHAYIMRNRVYVLNVVVNMANTENSKRQPHSCSPISIVRQHDTQHMRRILHFPAHPSLAAVVYYRILTSSYIFKQILILRYAFFCDFTMGITLIPYRHFWKDCRFHLQRSSSLFGLLYP